MPSFDLSGLRFTQPAYLWLLLMPGVLLAAWIWQAWRRRNDIGQMRKHRHLPGRQRSTERLPLLGRVSMDLIALGCDGTSIREGDWVEIDFVLEEASRLSGMSQYELLTGLGSRFERRWV